MCQFTNEIHDLLSQALDFFSENNERKRRRWGPRVVFLGLLVLVGSRKRMSYGSMIASMFDMWQEELGWERPPAESGFSKARDTVSVDDCRWAWQESLEYVESCVPESRRRGLPGNRTIAIDGSWVLTPATAGTTKRWQRNTARNKDGQLPNPQALVITGWELGSRMPVGFCVMDKNEGERQGALQLFDELRPGDHVLMDRGFPSDYILGELLEREIDFTIRMQAGKGNWAEVDEFLNSGKKDAIIKVEVVDRSGVKKAVPLRFVRRPMKRGRPAKGKKREEMVLLTSLLDADKHSAESIIKLYGHRWAVETAYEEMKVDFNIEEFHSNTPERIQQELYALMTWLTFASFIEIKAEQALEELRGPQTYDDPERYQINRRLLQDIVEWTIRDFFAGGERWAKRCRMQGQLMDYLAKRARKRRPGRSYKRTRRRPHGRTDIKKMKGYK